MTYFFNTDSLIETVNVFKFQTWLQSLDTTYNLVTP
jgi:hypothetical protein